MSSFEPGPGEYENTGGFDDKEFEQDILTSQFHIPVQKKIVPVNLYNPHGEPINEKKKHPEPPAYKLHREFDKPRFNAEEDFEPRLNLTAGGKYYHDSNLDRFGRPIRPMRPVGLAPGPGSYEIGSTVYPFLIGPKPPITSHGHMSDLV